MLAKYDYGPFYAVKRSGLKFPNGTVFPVNRKRLENKRVPFTSFPRKPKQDSK